LSQTIGLSLILSDIWQELNVGMAIFNFTQNAHLNEVWCKMSHNDDHTPQGKEVLHYVSDW
jgi:hypothetical protein